jgi:hypothetical protein
MSKGPFDGGALKPSCESSSSCLKIPVFRLKKQNPLPELIFLAAGFLETICAPSLLQLALLVESYARHPGSDAPVPVGIKSG